jgi:hypothetical protein
MTSHGEWLGDFQRVHDQPNWLPAVRGRNGALGLAYPATANLTLQIHLAFTLQM